MKISQLCIFTIPIRQFLKRIKKKDNFSFLGLIKLERVCILIVFLVPNFIVKTKFKLSHSKIIDQYLY